MRTFSLGIFTLLLILTGGFLAEANHYALACSFWFCGLVSLFPFSIIMMEDLNKAN